MTPSSQELESPGNPGRFSLVQGLFPEYRPSYLASDLTPLLGWTVGWACYGLISGFYLSLIVAPGEVPAKVTADEPISRTTPLAIGKPSMPPPVTGTALGKRLEGLGLFGWWMGIGVASAILTMVFEASPSPAIEAFGLAAATIAFPVVQGWIINRAFGPGVWFHWVAVTLAGGWIGAALGTSSAAGADLWSIVTASVVFGSTVGLAQWTVLRRSRRYAWVWIPVVGVSVVVTSLLVAWGEGWSFPARLVSRAITGAVLVWLYGRSNS